MAFTMKRNDLRPYLDAQFFEPDGVTPLDLTSATAVFMVCRLKGTAPADPPKFKKECDIAAPPTSGVVQYRWEDTDTDTVGQFEYEFEIQWPGVEAQTLPQDG